MSNGAPDGVDFILVRELNEVYLLLDHISGRWDKTFASLDSPGGGDSRQISIKEICEIRWPSPEGQKKQAEMAEILLRAKDKLNAAAKPANGATIAFTLMVVGEGDRPPKEPPQDGPDGMGNAGDPPTRISLAQRAFPGLIDGANGFRKKIRHMVWFLIILLGLTCVLSWYAATLNGILTHMDAVRAQERDLEKKMALMVVSTSQDAKELKAAALSQAATVTPTLRAPHTAEASLKVGLGQFSSDFCDNKVTQASISEKTADAIAMCTALGVNYREHDAVWDNLAKWLPWQVAQSQDGRASHEEGGRVVAQLLINSILPFLYGILGAGAAVVRDLWAKTRESLLSPRDYTLALGQLALGAITGACIGLFVHPTAAGAATESVLGGLALTASALSFVAGFGVEGAFLALESLVRRVFNQAHPAEVHDRRQ